MYDNENYSGSDNSSYSTYQTGGNSTFNSSYQQNYGEQNNYQETAGAGKGKEKKQKKQNGFLRKMLLCASLGLIFGLFGGIGFYAVQQGLGIAEQADSENVSEGTDQLVSSQESDSGIKLTNTNTVTVVESDISNVVEEVMPAMVSIVNNYTETGSFWGQTYTQEAASSGSGIIVGETDTELLMVTNYHVIEDATTLEVTFIDGNTAEAKIKGTDSDMDLAVIAVDLESVSEETKNEIAIAKLGDSDNLKLGEPVIAIGYALGYGQSVTFGFISALDREMTLSDGTTHTFIQTNAAINPGNSGGALLNMQGEVIGINSNKIASDTIEGMGYAIPISSASPIIAELMERQTRDKVEDGETGYMGIVLQPVTSQISQMYNMPTGVYVISVEEGSAAQEAGIMVGDIITRFDGEKISTSTDLENIMQYYAAGDTATLTIMRPEQGEYTEYKLEITLGSRPETTR